MMKRILAFLLAIILIGSLSACGKKNDYAKVNSDEIFSSNQQEKIEEQSSTVSKENENSVSIDDNEDASSTDVHNQSDEATELVDGLHPEFKAAMDSYEEFYDGYCEFMEKYKENPTNLEFLEEYTDMLSKADDVNKKFDAWNEEEMTDEEILYYIEVNNRVLEKLVEVAK